MMATMPKGNNTTMEHADLHESSENWAGAAFYSGKTLFIYDLLVLTFSNRWAWKCPTSTQLAFFEKNLSANHLDVGVGSGYYTSTCNYPGNLQRIVLMDLNAECLKFASRRMKPTGISPSCHVADVLEPIKWGQPRFDSISLFYLLHCLPGTMAEKARVFSHLSALLNPGGILYGTTILGKGTSPNAVAHKLMGIYNAKGIFSNFHDDAGTLEQGLKDNFASAEIHIAGEVAMFRAIKNEDTTGSMASQ